MGKTQVLKLAGQRQMADFVHGLTHPGRGDNLPGRLTHARRKKRPDIPDYPMVMQRA